MLNYEFTENARRVFFAARGTNEGFRLEPHPLSVGQVPAIGDEIEFPGITGKVVFSVVNRRFRMIDKDVGPSTLTLWLDAPENATGPVEA